MVVLGIKVSSENNIRLGILLQDLIEPITHRFGISQTLIFHHRISRPTFPMVPHHGEGGVANLKFGLKNSSGRGRFPRFFGNDRKTG